MSAGVVRIDRGVRPIARSPRQRGRGAATIARMPVWRCPHCGTPQAESSRCWVCRRSTTTCATCLPFPARDREWPRPVRPRRPTDRARRHRDPCLLGGRRAPSTQTLPAELVPVRELVLAGVPDTARRAPRTFVPVDELVGARRRDPDRRPVAGEAPARAASVSAPPAGAARPRRRAAERMVALGRPRGLRSRRRRGPGSGRALRAGRTGHVGGSAMTRSIGVPNGCLHAPARARGCSRPTSAGIGSVPGGSARRRRRR